MIKKHSTLKNAHQERDFFRRRLFLVALMVCILAGLLITRLVYLQIIDHQLYTTLARQNQLNLIPIEPNRGLIYDRNGVLLAENKPIYDLVITPSLVPNLTDTINGLKKLIPITDEDLQQFYKQLKLHRKFQPVPLRSKLTEEEVAKFSVNGFRFPGVKVKAQMIRYYPLGEAFAEIVGYVSRINAQELESVDPTNYSVTNFIGKTGVEKYYETLLHGTVGNQQVETNASGQVIRALKRIPPISGADLYLTIDSRLQIAIEQAMGNLTGAVVAIDPRTGEILAFVSNPSFNPNLFTTGISKTAYEALQKQEGQPLYNRALNGQYAPGSTIKPYIALEGLQSDTVSSDFTISDPGWFMLPGNSRVYHDWKKGGHGRVDIAKAIQQSCDIYFFTLGSKLGITLIDNVLSHFGFGRPTGVDLNDESPGLLPSPEWKKRALNEGWYPGDTIITAIGQGFLLVTPLQLAANVAALSMHGKRFAPHVLLQSVSNGVRTTVKPRKLSTVILDQDVWEVVLDAMHAVTSRPGGTAYGDFLGARYSVAGKTGTAQVFSLKKDEHYKQMLKENLIAHHLLDNSLFIAFAPIKNPRIAIGIIIQNSPIHAAVLGRKILDFYLRGNGDLLFKKNLEHNHLTHET